MLLPLPDDARTAFVIVDMQNFFFRHPERRAGLDAVIEKINQVSRACDKASMPVYHITSEYHADGHDWDLKMKAAGEAVLIQGSQEADFLPGLIVEPHHHKLIKTRYSAFFHTDLADQLHTLGIQRVMVAGGYTHYCVNATVFDAYSHDFVPGLIQDGVISHLPAEAAIILDRMRRNGYHLMTAQDFCLSLSQ